MPTKKNKLSQTHDDTRETRSVSSLKDAFHNIFASKLRSFLAVLGILVGTASVVAMVSGGELATQQALNQFKKLGTNLISVSINDGERKSKKETDIGKQSTLDLKTALALKHSSSQIKNVAPYTSLYFPLYFKGQKIDGGLIGTVTDFAIINKLQLLNGRFVSQLDRYNHYAVIGQNVYQQLLKQNKNPLSTQIKIGRDYFTIIGILKKADNNSFIYADINSAVFVPLQTSLTLSKYAQINNIIFKLTPNPNIEKIKKEITKAINQSVSDKQLYFRDPSQFIEQMQKQRQILTVFLGFIGGISLLVGGIGIMNIMLVSVTERRREIGVRLAVGATPRNIQSLFLVEAVILSLFGGIFGVLLGILISFIIAKARHWGFTLFLYPPIIGFCVSVFVGIFFGCYPAYKASQLDPIDALRAE